MVTITSRHDGGRGAGRRPVVLTATLAVLLVPSACAGGGGTESDPEPNGNEPPLRELAEARGLGIGSAADRSFHLTGAEGATFRDVLGREFNVLTPENDMKHVRIHPEEERYDFDRADALVEFAEAEGMRVRGHTLVWHRQLAEWLTGGSWTAEQAEALLREHVSTVAGHYRGRLAAWDVVNEAVDDDGSPRSSFWAESVGPDYIEIAFREARDADPGADLFYNDYGILWMNPKSDSVHAMLSRLLDGGVPVDGIGFQGHMVVGTAPSRSELAANFQRFADLGLKIHITELDVRIPLPASGAELQQQALDFGRVVEVCAETPACEMVVTWGFTDRDSWIPTAFPGYGAALLFDEDYEPKPSYLAVHDALAGG